MKRAGCTRGWYGVATWLTSRVLFSADRLLGRTPPHVNKLMRNLFRNFRSAWLTPLILIIPASGIFCFQLVTRPPDIPFEKHTIDLGSSESAAIADINGDGKPDIVSGENWYEAPRWQKHHFRDILFTNNYIDD